MFPMWLTSKEKGQGLVEYAILLVFIAVVVIAVVVVLGKQIADVFQTISDKLAG